MLHQWRDRDQRLTGVIRHRKRAIAGREGALRRERRGFRQGLRGRPYPSDIMGSIGLGLLAVSLFHNPSVHRPACRVVAVEQIHRLWFYLMAFLFTYQVATVFDDVCLIGRGLFSAVLQHDPFGGS